MTTYTAENAALESMIAYDETGASIVGVDDWRPYVVKVDGKSYRFPDRWAAREFAALYMEV